MSFESNDSKNIRRSKTNISIRYEESSREKNSEAGLSSDKEVYREKALNLRSKMEYDSRSPSITSR